MGFPCRASERAFSGRTVMTLSEINNIAELMAAAGRRNVPVPIEEWESLMKAKAGEKMLDIAGLDHWGRTFVQNSIDSRLIDDVIAALQALIKNEVSKAMASHIGPATIKDGKIKPIRKQSASQRAASHKKAARIEKGLKANRERAKAKKG